MKRTRKIEFNNLATTETYLYFTDYPTLLKMLSDPGDFSRTTRYVITNVPENNVH